VHGNGLRVLRIVSYCHHPTFCETSLLQSLVRVPDSFIHSVLIVVFAMWLTRHLCLIFFVRLRVLVLMAILTIITFHAAALAQPLFLEVAGHAVVRMQSTSLALQALPWRALEGGQANL